MPRPLILGAIEGYNWAQLRPFVTSLRTTGYEGDLVFFHRRIDSETLQKLGQHGVRLLPLVPRGLRNPWTGRRHLGEGALGWALALTGRIMAGTPLPRSWRTRHERRWAERFFHVANARYVLAHHFLEQHGGDYDQVMITDVRDVIFQANPFSYSAPGELATFFEDAGMTLRTNQNYREWIAAAWGEEYSRQHQDERISCCAITLGPTAAMREYLRHMTDGLLRHRGVEAFRFGLDSAVHNRLLWEGTLPRLVALENYAGPVLTLGGVAPEPWPTDGPLRNRDGSIVSILHQYDRHPALLEALGKRQPALAKG